MLIKKDIKNKDVILHNYTLIKNFGQLWNHNYKIKKNNI